MKVVSNASPLIALARVGRLSFLQTLYGTVHISKEVYDEVAVAGTGRPGALAVAQAGWIPVSVVRDGQSVASTISHTGFGVGEVSAIFLAKELKADLLLMDEWKARRLAIREGLPVVGCVGILEELYRRGDLSDLREIYRELLAQKIWIDQRILQASLYHFGLMPL